jgi:hypothetical protein
MKQWNTAGPAIRGAAKWKQASPARRTLLAYILRTDVMNAHKHLLTGKGVSVGKGAIRYSKPERIDFGVVEKMLRATQESKGPIC